MKNNKNPGKARENGPLPRSLPTNSVDEAEKST
jgi:hypothetical protein